MAKKVQLQTNGKEWQVIDGEQVLVDVEKQDIDPITSSSCVQIEGFRTLEEAVSDNKMLSQDLTYTKVMDKVGGDYHQNVLDGQYSKAILYGNTQINLCEEDTSVALQIPKTFTSFNNGELQINNKESQVVAPLIKGVTMVNLAQISSSSITSGNGLPIHNVKGNTLYTLSFKFTTKNTNSGVVIQSYDANGTYLENTMHKTELGDVVKFTFTTHANATKVHICNNAAYGGETIQLDEIMLIEGDQTALDLPFFKGMRSVELSRPLTNLFTDDITTYESGASATNSSGNVVATSKSSGSWSAISYKMSMLKNNTKYLVMWDSLTTTQTSTSNTGHLISVYYVDTSSQAIGTINNNSLCPTKRSLIFDTKDFDVNKVWLKIHATLNNTETGTTTVKGLRVFEWDDYLRSVDLQSIGWFSGTKNVAVEPVKTCSKNLYPYGDVNFTSAGSNWYDAKGNINMYGDIASKSKSRFLLKKGTYTLSIGSTQNIEQYGLVDDKETTYSNTFTLSQDTYMTLRFKRIQAETLTTATNIQIERGETATNYVAHDSRYYEPDGQNAIVLRSLPDGVCDTFNLQTGEYIQRIGEAVLDGDEQWISSTNFSSTYNSYYFVLNEAFRNNIKYANDKYQLLSGGEDLGKKIGIHMGSSQGKIAPFISSDKMTLSEFKEYLQQNPVTVQYELATPVTTIIPRTIKRNNNGTVSTVDFKTYTNKENLRLPKNPSYLTINSMTSIKPVVEPITYIDFKTRLKANTDYTIKLNKETNAFVTTNLGGTSVIFNTGDTQKLVKTPSINLEQNLRISGSGSIQNIMVIEGDVLNKELPYFNGMCNVKMPIVRNMGRNLLDNNNVRVTYDTNIILRAYPTFPCKPGKRYVYCVDKLGAESACNWYSCKRDAVLVHSMKAFGMIQNLGYSNSIIAPPDCKYLSIYTGGSTSVDPYSIHAYVYEVDTLAEAQAIGYTDYKENQICLVQGEIGLTPDMFESGGMTYPINNGLYPSFEDCKADSATRIRTKECIPLKSGVVYRIVCVGSSVQTYFYDASKKSIEFTHGWNTNELTFTTPTGASYMSLMFKNDSKLSVTDFMNKITLQLLELDSTVQLRSLPNGVKDELNLLTGEYIQRVGEVVIDGSQTLQSERPNHKRMYIVKDDMKKLQNYSTSMVCDKFNVSMGYSELSGTENTWVSGYTDTVNLYPNQNWIYFNIENIENVSDMTTYLQQNPITVQYELAEPIISYPRIVSNTQEREVGVKLPNGVCDTYNPSTGITVKRVGKAILDGSEKISNHNNSNWMNDSVYGIKIQPPKDIALMTQSSYGSDIYNMFSDSLPMVWSKGPFGANKEGIGLYNEDRILYASIGRSKLATQDLNGVKAYLASNPITLYYELANPIVTTDIVLPNGVHDEYNPLTGLYTKRVGFIEFDGSDDENWVIKGAETENYKGFYVLLTNITPKPLPNSSIINNNFNTINDEIWLDLDREGSYIGGAAVAIIVAKSKLTTQDIDGLRLYLSQNPLKVWYELSTPITYQLTPYFGLPMPYAYQGGHLIMDSAYDGQTLPPEITYQLTVNRTGQITQNNIKLKEHTARLSNLEAILIEATLDSIFNREMTNFELELMDVPLVNLGE